MEYIKLKNIKFRFNLLPFPLHRMQAPAVERGIVCGVLYRADMGELHLPNGVSVVPDDGSDIGSDEEEQSGAELPGSIFYAKALTSESMATYLY